MLRLIGHQHWIPEGIRARGIRIACDPATEDRIHFNVPFFGYRYAGVLNCTLDWYVYFFGAYARRELFLLRDLLSVAHDKMVLDVGANVGQHSLFLSKYASWVHAFEPWELVRQRLLEKVRLNSIRNITVHDVGISDRNEVLPYYAPTTANTGSGSFSPTHDASNSLLRQLPLVCGDEYLNSVGVERVGLVKIDVEGWERRVLCGLRRTLALSRPIILVEVSATTRASFEDERELANCFPEGYQLRACRECRFSMRLDPFDFGRLGNIVAAPREVIERIAPLSLGRGSRC